jgi:hypothetical protein
MKSELATGEVFFAAFKALRPREREAFIEKVVRDARLREELLDLALMEEARKVRGKAISARAYFARRRREGKNS